MIPRACTCRAPRPISTTSASRRARCICAVGDAPEARGRLIALDLEAVRAAPGVVAVLTAADIPGKNDVAPAFARRSALRRPTRSCFHGQALSPSSPRPATRRAAPHGSRKIEIAGASADRHRRRCAGSAARACCRTMRSAAATRRRASPQAPHRLEGQFAIGGQEHFYLEGQVALAIPGEDGDMHRPCLDAGPDRGAAHRRPHARHPGRLRHRRDAPHGRRLRRQGKPGLRNGRRWRRSPRASPAGRARSGSIATMISRSPASATISAPTGESASTTRAAFSGYDVDAQRALRLFGRSVARRRATARCSMPTTAIGCPVVAIAYASG